jgi:hypothetical protein
MHVAKGKIYIHVKKEVLCCKVFDVLPLGLLNYLTFKYFGFDVPAKGHSKNAL